MTNRPSRDIALLSPRLSTQRGNRAVTWLPSAPHFEAAIGDPNHQRLLAVWRSLAGMRHGFPVRADISPHDFPTLLPHVFLLQSEAYAEGYRARLIGTGIVDALKMEGTGKALADLFRPTDVARLTSLLDIITRDRACLFGHLWLQPRVGLPRPWRLLGMPVRLAPESERIDLAFGLAVPLPSDTFDRDEALIAAPASAWMPVAA